MDLTVTVVENCLLSVDLRRRSSNVLRYFFIELVLSSNICFHRIVVHVFIQRLFVYAPYLCFCGLYKTIVSLSQQNRNIYLLSSFGSVKASDLIL